MLRTSRAGDAAPLDDAGLEALADVLTFAASHPEPSRQRSLKRLRPKNLIACLEGAYPSEVHSHRVFENPPALPHDTVLGILSRALSEDSAEAVQAKAASAMVGAALNDDDRAFIEQCCFEVAARAEPGCHLLGLVGLCLGHAARRFGTLSDEAIALAESLARRAEHDAADVDGRALDGLDDIQHFIRR